MNDRFYKKVTSINRDQFNIDPSVVIGKNFRIGLNVIIEEGVVIGDDCFMAHNIHIRPNAVIGNNVELRSFVHVDPDAQIGDNTHVFPYGLVGGGWKIGKNVWIGPFTCTTNSSIPTVLNPSSIGDYCIIYTGAKIAPGITMSPGSVLGINSVLTKSTGPLEIWWGVPAKMKKYASKKNLFIADDKPWPDVLKEFVRDM